jgi:hypothetical protein
MDSLHLKSSCFKYHTPFSTSLVQVSRTLRSLKILDMLTI